MLAAHDRGMTNGEYVFIYPNLLPSENWERLYYDNTASDETNRKARSAFRPLVQVVLLVEVFSNSSFSAKSWQNLATIDIQWIAIIECRCWQDSARISQEMINCRKTRMLVHWVFHGFTTERTNSSLPFVVSSSGCMPNANCLKIASEFQYFHCDSETIFQCKPFSFLEIDSKAKLVITIMSYFSHIGKYICFISPFICTVLRQWYLKWI